jgi:hypothetical protein
MFLTFSTLALPADHPFWTAKEELGLWKDLGKRTETKFLTGPGMLFSDHGLTGAAEIRPGKIHNESPSYNRLVYSSAFPWEADSSVGATASLLTIERTKVSAKPQLPDHVDLAGFRGGVFYRQAVFTPPSLPAFVDTASIIIPGGEIHIERFRKVEPSCLLLGHFGLPHLAAPAKVTRREVDGKMSVQLAIPGRQLAVTNYLGWDKVDVAEHHHLNAEAADSSLPYLERKDDAQYGAVDILVSILLHRTDDTPFTDEDLQPIKSIAPLKEGIPMQLGGLLLRLKNGAEYAVDFQWIDGASSRE